MAFFFTSARTYTFFFFILLFFFAFAFCHHYMQIKPAENLTSARFPLFHHHHHIFPSFFFFLSFTKKDRKQKNKNKKKKIECRRLQLFSLGLCCFDSTVTSHIDRRTHTQVLRLMTLKWCDVISLGIHTDTQRERMWWSTKIRVMYCAYLRAILLPSLDVCVCMCMCVWCLIKYRLGLKLNSSSFSCCCSTVSSFSDSSV